MYARNVDGELKVVAHYYLCRTCGGKLKLPDGKTCSECKGWGWEWGAGETIKKLGKPVEVSKLATPADPLSEALWEEVEEAS